MQRDLDVRLGCDLCKTDPPTHGYCHFPNDRNDRLWFCERCLKILLEWPEQKVT